MKATLIEGEEQFLMQITPEDINEVSILSRITLAYKRVPVDIQTMFDRDGVVLTEIFISKKQNFDPWIGVVK